MIKINGKIFYGNSISISRNKVIVDGVEVTDEDVVNSKTVNITVEGNLQSIEADYVNQVEVKGTVGSIETTSGDVHCKDVSGDVNTTSGDVDVEGYVNGSIQTMSGNVICGTVEGNVKTMSGNIKRR